MGKSRDEQGSYCKISSVSALNFVNHTRMYTAYTNPLWDFDKI